MLIAPACPICDTPLQQLRNDSLCERCWSAIRPFSAPICHRCGDPLALPRQSSGRASSVRVETGASAHDFRLAIDKSVSDAGDPLVCVHCANHQGSVDCSRAIGSHDGALRDAIHALKYGKRQSIATRLGGLMRLHGGDVLADADIAIPVPLHWSRRYKRGFNQAELLASQLGLPVGHLLRRVRRTRPQVDLPARQRQANVHRAFALRRRDTWAMPASLRRRVGTSVAGLTVVLVDDVTTTGATLEACAAVLKSAGAKDVRVLTAARVATKSY